jgi:alkanesulfonate monooxygenase SsuD/methylene tetrahydromethanopterin reductase-like flavin-dependent oxidoreductase (luciferase family)
MADERAIEGHVVPRITKAAAEAGRPAPRIVAGIPVTLCRNEEVDDVRGWANQALAHAEHSPNYQRLLDEGDATDVGDICAAGDEATVLERLRAFRDAGATDVAVRVLPYGHDRAARIESRDRTIAFLAGLCPEI